MEDKPICAFCTGSLDEGEVHRCGKCAGMLHETCWHANGGHCATMGCPNSGATVRGKKNELIAALKQDLTDLDKKELEARVRKRWMKNGAMTVLRFAVAILDIILHVIMMFVIGILPFRAAQNMLCVKDAKTAEEMGSVLEMVVFVGCALFFNSFSYFAPTMICLVAAIFSLVSSWAINRPLILPLLLSGVYGIFYYAPKLLITETVGLIKDEYELYISEQVDEEAEKKQIEEAPGSSKLEKSWEELCELDNSILSYLGEIKGDSSLEEREKIHNKILSALCKMNVKNRKTQGN